jgi:hypothetical protein
VVALIVGAIGLANRAFFAERASALIYAVVADSRGVYMSSEAADRANSSAR